MESLWRVWESARQDPEGGLSLWFLEHADEQMKVFMSTEGPFEHLQNSEQDFSPSTEPLAWRPPPRAVGSDDELEDEELEDGEVTEPVGQRVAQAAAQVVGDQARAGVLPRRTPASIWCFRP